eukprot:gene48361-59224_t
MNNANFGRATLHGERSVSESDARQDRESEGQTPEVNPSTPFKASERDAGTTRDTGNETDVGIGPEGAGGSRAQRGPACTSGLPRQNSNNSDKPEKRYRMKHIRGSDGFFTSKDNKRATWDQIDPDTFRRNGMPSSAEANITLNLIAAAESASGPRRMPVSNTLLSGTADSPGSHESSHPGSFCFYLVSC